MRVELMFPSKYLCAADLIEAGRDVPVTITRVFKDELQTRDGKREEKWLLEFDGAKKKLVLNKTNAGTIAALHGLESDAWIGRRITLYPEKVLSFGKLTDAIRIRPTAPAAGRKPTKNGTALAPLQAGPSHYLDEAHAAAHGLVNRGARDGWIAPEDAVGILENIDTKRQAADLAGLNKIAASLTAEHDRAMTAPEQA